MKKVLFAALGSLAALTLATPAMAQHGGRHHDQHHRLEDRHDRQHDRLDERHDRAHYYGVNRREHRRLHRSLENQHHRNDHRLERRHDDQHDRRYRRRGW